jgi:hypothetical protein
LQQDPPTVPFYESDIVSAIEKLEATTASIEQQCTRLASQRTAILALREFDKPKTSLNHTFASRQKAQRDEKHRLDIETEELAAKIDEALQIGQETTESAKTLLGSSAESVLEADDRAAARLSKILSAVEPGHGGSSSSKEVEKLCQALVGFRTADINARIDGIVTGATGADSISANSSNDGNLLAERDGLKEEIATLCAEVSSVAEMAVDHVFRAPLLRSESIQGVKVREIRLSWLDYTLHMLHFLSERLITSEGLAKDLGDYITAFKTVAAALKTIGSDTAQFNPKPEMKPMNHSNSVSFPPPSSTLSLVSPAVRTFLQTHDLPDNPSPTTLSAVTASRQSTTLSRLDNHTVGIIDMLGSVVSKADTELQAILSALYVNTKYRSISLMSPGLEVRQQKLQESMDEIRQSMGGFEQNGVPLDERKIKILVERWREN